MEINKINKDKKMNDFRLLKKKAINSNKTIPSGDKKNGKILCK